MKYTCHLALLAALTTGAAWAQPAPFADRLSGDWNGARSRLAQSGVTLNLDWTQFTQGLMSGSGSKSWRYAGRFDAYVNLNTGALGWWQGGLIRTHTEYAYGRMSPWRGGTVMPTSLGPGLPLSGREHLEMTSLHLVQRLDERVNLIVGKINTVDLIAGEPFFGGAGNDRFFNLAFAAPPNGLLSPVIMGAMLAVGGKPYSGSVVIYGPGDRTDRYSPSGLFDDGFNVMLSAKWEGLVGGRTSSVALTGIHSSKERADLSELLLPPPQASGATGKASHASVQLSHFLTESAPGRGDGWGVFAKLGWSDGRLNPIQGFVTGGVGGKGLVASRPDDRFGLGFFHYDFSDALQSAVSPLLRLRNERGVEAYYDLALVPGARLAFTLQHIHPAIASNKNATVAGARVKLLF